MPMLGIALAVCCPALMACSWALIQARRQVVEVRGALTRVEAAVAEGEARSARLAGDLETRREEVAALKQDVAVQRKKNHAMQQSLKAAQAEAKQERARRVKAQNTRPAFAELKEVMPEVDPAPRASVAPRPVERARPAPVSPDMAAQKREVELLTRLRTAEAEAAHLQTLCAGEQTQLTDLKAELHKLRRRAEDLRRIDIISRSRTELLEDKLRSLARLHYDAISELAVLRGEVTPPRPREAVEPEPTNSQFNDDAADGPHVPVSLLQ